MPADPSKDYEARQLALIREQRPIVEALRERGYEIEFLFAPPPGPVPEEARGVLARFLEQSLSLESRLMICDLLERRSSEVSVNPAASTRSK